ncbi:serine/threonine-protein kinase [Leptolyngbya sp. FACHB-261]|uniref:serine/threonine protein kinase n=1 Tax=Leptolyngbya sp. FACHB-261 TaxID=2692806 RepID=UPI001683CB36|nr:serine/threonine-protein kinase [Leptolyngbya sp. FACHB-261]MBD2102956.1 serine/threonine protein kinase [Leptolyngbya sp. FACHB-261]
MSWTAGQTLQNGKYCIERELGRGGVGITYLALHQRLNKQVVIKALNCNGIREQVGRSRFPRVLQTCEERFSREAKLLARCEHPNIVRVIDISEEPTETPDGKMSFMVMDYIPGQNLLEMVKEEGALAEDKALAYIRQIGSALLQVHSIGLLHRDVKPQNIMVHERSDQAILIDFGIAREFSPQTYTIAYSPGFASPEHHSGRCTTASDVYSLAATLYFLFTEETPPNANFLHEPDYADSLQCLTERASPTVHQAILRALAYQPEQRPQTVDQWLRELDGELAPSCSSSNTSTSNTTDKAAEATVQFLVSPTAATVPLPPPLPQPTASETLLEKPKPAISQIPSTPSPRSEAPIPETPVSVPVPQPSALKTSTPQPSSSPISASPVEKLPVEKLVEAPVSSSVTLTDVLSPSVQSDQVDGVARTLVEPVPLRESTGKSAQPSRATVAGTIVEPQVNGSAKTVADPGSDQVLSVSGLEPHPGARQLGSTTRVEAPAKSRTQLLLASGALSVVLLLGTGWFMSRQSQAQQAQIEQQATEEQAQQEQEQAAREQAAQEQAAQEQIQQAQQEQLAQDQETLARAKGSAATDLAVAIQTAKTIQPNSPVYAEAQQQSFNWQATLLQEHLVTINPDFGLIKPKIRVEADLITVTYDASVNTQLQATDGIKTLALAFMDALRSKYTDFNQLVVYPQTGKQQVAIWATQWTEFRNGKISEEQLFQVSNR